MRANCESIQRTSHCIRFQVILREASFSVIDTGFTNETDWISESKIGDNSCRSLVWDVVLGDFQPERTGPCLVLSPFGGFWHQTYVRMENFTWRRLNMQFFFRRETWSFPKDPRCL